jgi:hypothetical protein
MEAMEMLQHPSLTFVAVVVVVAARLLQPQTLVTVEMAPMEVAVVVARRLSTDSIPAKAETVVVASFIWLQLSKL